MFSNLTLKLNAFLMVLFIISCSANDPDTQKIDSAQKNPSTNKNFTGLSVYKDPVTGKFVSAPPTNSGQNNSNLIQKTHASPSLEAHTVETQSGGNRVYMPTTNHNN